MFKVLFLILVVMSSMAFSQDPGKTIESSETVNQNLVSQIVDEFGPLAHCDLGARMDAFASALQSDSKSKGYIIFYQGENDLPSEIENPNRAKILYVNYLTENRGLDRDRIVLISSYRQETATELWIVPENAEPPKPKHAIAKPKISLDKTLLYDRNSIEFEYWTTDYTDFLTPLKKAEYEENERVYRESLVENDSAETPAVGAETPAEEEVKLSDEELQDLKFNWTSDRFGNFLEKNKKIQGVIMFYADDQHFDINKVTNHIEEGKQRIAREAKISPDRIQVIFGGYKSYVEIEFWAVPEKGSFPTPEPDERIIKDKPDPEVQ